MQRINFEVEPGGCASNNGISSVRAAGYFETNAASEMSTLVATEHRAHKDVAYAAVEHELDGTADPLNPEESNTITNQLLDAEAADLVERMMDTPHAYRCYTKSSSAVTSSLPLVCAAATLQASPASNSHQNEDNFEPAGASAASSVPGSMGAVPAYPPGSELRLRAKRPHESCRSILKEVFGFDEFRDKQEDVIELVLAGHSCLYVTFCPPHCCVFSMWLLTSPRRR
jgi:hypothetical protein